MTKLSAHAYLFVGPDQVGKKKKAVELASGIAEKHDILVISPSESISIDAIRDLKKFIGLKSYAKGARVAIIDDAHKMTEEAQNALLKILEEPNEFAKIILITSHPIALSDTIRSRCELRNFTSSTKKEFESFFANDKLNSKQIQFLFEFSGGSMGLAIDTLADGVMDDLKSASKELSQILSSNLGSRFEKARILATDKDDLSRLRKKVLYWLRHAHASKSRKILRPLLYLHLTLQSTQFNRRSALERFMIELPTN